MVFDVLQVWDHPRDFFSKGEYLIGDSGYAPNSAVLPAFKRLSTEVLSADQTKFNTALSEIRMVIEHVNGMLKSRFQCLKEARQMLRDKRSCARLNTLISVCCVLHNWLLEQGEGSCFHYETSTQRSRDEDEAFIRAHPSIEVEILEDSDEGLRTRIFEQFCAELHA